ncbi:MAG: phosphoenolpyruvate--protein phosphotransferase [Alphaproteobacteria bacterium]|nr:phosphoenolpyruvate--protein phosphotransferase [Alphaproteobacteria bacterium]
MGAWGGVPRQLLRRLRDIMAGAGSAQERLDRVVKIIAAEMVAEVCSAYVRRAGDVLELCATEGLRPEAVHRTTLRVGEGLVGDIAEEARPLALADAQAHPNFAYRPETGEEIFHSLMGVPILREGRVLGVLVVQNRTMRQYTEEEIETLETIAMVLAELAASGELVSRALPGAPGVEPALPLRLPGVRICGGIAIGRAVLHQPTVVIRRVVAEDPEVELARLRAAVAELHDALDRMMAAADLSASGEHRDVLEAYRMFAEDRGWLGRIREAIRSGLTAEAAVQKVQNDTRVRMNQIEDEYLRERLQDLEDLNNRLLQHLAGAAGAMPAAELPDDAVLVAHNLGPAELLDYDRRKLRAVVLEEGSPTAHVSIVARALDIPVVGRVKDVFSRVDPLDPMIVDGDGSVVLLRPAEEAKQAFAQAIRARAEREAAYAKLRGLPAETRDSVAISLNINAGLLLDLGHLDDGNADGVGLYRTEIPFMIRAAFPDVRAQEELYRQVLRGAGDRPVTFRTLDVGGDKLLPYFASGHEDNPAMGWRAIRIALDRPFMLRQQLRALVRAAQGRELRVMFPMIAEVAEFEAARRIMELEVQHAMRRGGGPRSVKVGAMLEVPALAYQLSALFRIADFVSVGSNDLIQFLFAADRGSPRLAERYDVLSPPVLSLLRELVAHAEAAGKPLALCGEMAGRPIEAMALIGLGFRNLSMSPSSVGPVKAMVRRLQIGPLADFMRVLCQRSEHSVRETLRTFARDHEVPV